jgi:hypothetical protein
MQRDSASYSSHQMFVVGALAAAFGPPYHPVAFQMWLIKIDGVGHPWMDLNVSCRARRRSGDRRTRTWEILASTTGEVAGPRRTAPKKRARGAPVADHATRHGGRDEAQPPSRRWTQAGPDIPPAQKGPPDGIVNAAQGLSREAARSWVTAIGPLRISGCFAYRYASG